MTKPRTAGEMREEAAKVCDHLIKVIGVAPYSSIWSALTDAKERIRAIPIAKDIDAEALVEKVKALFRDEPKTVYFAGYNSAIEDALAVISLAALTRSQGDSQ